MGVSGAWFPPAGALAVLFVDNHALRTTMGRAYCLMPGISGTSVLFLLALIKVEIFCGPKETKANECQLDSKTASNKAEQPHPTSKKPYSSPSPAHGSENASSDNGLLDWLCCSGQ